MLSIFSSKNNVTSVKNKLNIKIKTPTNPNNQYFKNLPKKGMKKSKENENKVQSEYYKCIIYIFSLSLILLEIKGINIQKAESYIDVKNTAIKKIQNHLDIIKKKNNSIYESIKIKYLSQLFNYNGNIFEKKFFQKPNELASIKLDRQIKKKNDILIILNDYDIFNSNQIFYKIIDNDFDINKVIWNNKNPDLFSINNFIYIDYDGLLKSGSYGSVYMIKGIKNRILKITDIVY